MTTTEKLKLMQEIKAVNDARVQEFLNVKFQEWKISYAFITPDGVAHEDEFYWLKAQNIEEAISIFKGILAKMAAEFGWHKWMIWNVGIACTETDDPSELF